MWVLKARLDAKNFPLGNAAMKFNVSLTGYPLSCWKEGKALSVIMAGFLFGKEKDKKTLINYLKKSKILLNFETSGDFLIGIVKQPLAFEVMYNPKLIRTNPAILSHEGYVIWELASWDKTVLMKAFEFAKKYHGAKLLQLKKENINNIIVAGVIPKVTKKQKEALRLAIQHGYYDYPKKIGLVELAKKMKLAYSTFQAHLKKAEGKLLKYTVKRV